MSILGLLYQSSSLDEQNIVPTMMARKIVPGSYLLENGGLF